MRGIYRVRRPWLVIAVLLCYAPVQATTLDSYRRAAEYSAAHGGQATLVVKGSSVVFEAYYNGYAADQPHYLASGTKSCSCAIAVVAQMDSLLTLDELAADTFPTWRTDPPLSRITIRQLLDFTSGLDPGLSDTAALGMPDLPEESTTPLVRPLSDPGTIYRYGSSHLTAFKLLIRRKLAQAKSPDRDALALLTHRVLDPIGLRVGHWLRDDGNQPELAGGAELTAREWAKYGLLIKDGGQWNGQSVLDARLLAECFHGSAVMPAYGLTWWLNQPVTEAHARQTFAGLFASAGADRYLLAPAAPRDLVMALGQGDQAMVIVPSLDLVAVHFGSGGAWDFREYLRLLLS
jgi:CubicO group peptidase (beta-lactamase class C family)